MPGELLIPFSRLLGLALLLARIGGAVSFVPLPGLSGVPVMAKIILTVSISLALLPVAPDVAISSVGAGTIALWMFGELAFGACVGVAVAILNEAFILASQIFGLQAGYGYASTIDPATQADSSVLQLFTHLAAGLLFFSMGLHRNVIRAFAGSLEVHPPGTFPLTIASAEHVLQLGTEMFGVAVRLALPVVALLMLVDLSLALLGRINAQMQLLMLAFPAKMLLSMGLLAALCALLPNLYRSLAEQVFGTLGLVLGLER